jgi:hypothetical protein
MIHECLPLGVRVRRRRPARVPGERPYVRLRG